MNVYARFDEIPSITLKDIKKIKRKIWTNSDKSYLSDIAKPWNVNRISESQNFRQTANNIHVPTKTAFCQEYNKFYFFQML